MADYSTQEELLESIQRLYTNFKKTSIDRQTISYLETRSETLEDYWSKFVADHREIIKEGEITKEEKQKLKNLYSQAEDNYLDFKTILKEKIAALRARQNVTQLQSSSSSATITKLPPINIPTFSGNYHEWLSFKDLFISMIHNDQGLSDIQKHHYLRSSLKGEAEQLVRHFDVTAANYDKAWNALVNRYSNTRVIVNTILNRLLNQKKLTTECPKGLKDLLDTTNQSLNSLSNMNIDITSWDPIVVHLVVSKLDNETHKGWEQSLGSSIELPTYKKLTMFLEGRFRAIEMIQTSLKKEKKEQTYSPSTITQKSKTVKSFTAGITIECSYCQKSHYICHCTEFTQLDVDKRKQFVKNNNLCFNCLVKGHSVQNCRQVTSCRICHRKHHTLLHLENVVSKPLITETPTIASEVSETPITSMKVAMTNNNQVLLATAQVGVKDRRGTIVYFRALVDQGSQATFITESAAQLLNLKKTPLSANVTGIGNHAVKARHIVNLDIYSPIDTHYVMQVKAHVLTKLTPMLPTKEFDITQWPTLSQVKLADPHLNKPGPIDLLLGADVYACILLQGLHKFDTLLAQNSRLGWLVSGATKATTELPSTNITVSTALLEVDHLLRKFWETEEYQPHEKPMTLLDQQCEDHYKKTHSRQEDGRYIVRLPFKDAHEENLGDARQIALHRLKSMEKRFAHQPEFKKDYTDFIKQYQALNHMEDVNPQEKLCHKPYILPHHAVVRQASTTTKLRVVFDGSAKPSDGSALNDQLLVGPPLQQDLRDLIIRWRTHKICLLADVKQMYRQILVAKEDVDYQRILWRSSPQDDIIEKRLLTVTYGTSCAPFLAIRTLKQLSQDEKSNYPDLVDIINNDFYMDDLLTGASDEESAAKLQSRISQVMAKGKFEMHKWASNSSEVLKSIPNTAKTNQESVNIKLDDTIKALGIKWNSHHDVFELKLEIYPSSEPFTKTSVLSDIARAFDPLGFLGPVIVTAKIFLQKLWLSGINWIDELPLELATEWSSYRDQLVNMPTLYLERWVHTQKDGTEKVEIHGFSDASCLAYAAVVYLRVISSNGIHVSLVIAKSKVAPVKQVSVPRLELCGAVLLSKLLKDVQRSLQLPEESVFAWTDSMIVLAWLRRSPNTWKTYVANRVTEIVNNVSSGRWHHIKSADNPADVASRGIRPDLMKDCDLWWLGPKFLNDCTSFDDRCSSSLDIPVTQLEAKEKCTLNLQHITSLSAGVSGEDDERTAYLARYSSLRKLVRITAYLFRFVNICKSRIEAKINRSDPETFPKYLTVCELRSASNVCIRLSQDIWFQHEIQLLKKKRQLQKSSALSLLVPFIDENGLVRVTGRLHNARVHFNTMSPIVLASKCQLASLIVHDTHLHCLHGGPQLTLNVLRFKYWIIGAKNLVKKVVSRCFACYKQSAAPINQLMGQLPACRVTPAKPFRNSGVDFAGPVQLKLYPGRCNRTCKAYIALFICTVTKAIHLELVSDLTTAAFIAAFRRFTSRRGHCSDLWSDCATNFVGACKELDLMFKNRNSEAVGEIAEILANDNTNWHFIPPGSPHFGGLWEAGVKSIKTHLKRVIGLTLLTFEEYTTLLTQVESCVNSRPLSPISNSIDDVSPITPGHFLIGEAPINVPEESLESVTGSRLDRWQMLQKMLQTLWSRWSSEYLTTLQNRSKWTVKNQDPEIGNVVLVKDERLPPGKWLLGRIIDKHPGRDGLTRVVTLKFKNSTFRRPITKICPLPLDA